MCVLLASTQSQFELYFLQRLMSLGPKTLVMAVNRGLLLLHFVFDYHCLLNTCTCISRSVKSDLVFSKVTKALRKCFWVAQEKIWVRICRFSFEAIVLELSEFKLPITKVSLLCATFSNYTCISDDCLFFCLVSPLVLGSFAMS